MTKSQELFFKAGVYQERSKNCLELRKYHNDYYWNEYTEESKKWKAKAGRFLKRACKEDLTPYPFPELNDLVKQGMELESKGYKMRPELVHKGDKYFIVFERDASN